MNVIISFRVVSIVTATQEQAITGLEDYKSVFLVGEIERFEGSPRGIWSQIDEIKCRGFRARTGEEDT